MTSPRAAADAVPPAPVSVFVCHSSADVRTAEMLNGVLEEAGHRLWTYRRQLRPGQNWHDEMLDGVIRSDVLVLLAGEAAFRSRACIEELKCAREHGKRVVVVQVGALMAGSAVPAAVVWVRQLQWIVSTADRDELRRDLLAALATDNDRVRALTRLDIRATEWDRRHRPRRLLLAGGEIASAQELVAAPVDPAAVAEARPTPVVGEFVGVSRRRRTQVRTLSVLVALVVVSTLVATLVVAAERRRDQLTAQRAQLVEQLQAEAQQLAEDDPARSLRLALTAYTLDESPTRHARLARTTSSNRLRRLLREPGSKTRAVAYTRKGTLLLSSGLDETLRSYAPDSTDPVAERDLGTINSIAVAADSDLVAVDDQRGPFLGRVSPDGAIDPLAPLPAGSPPFSLSGDGRVLATGPLVRAVALMAVSQAGAIESAGQIPAEVGVVRAVRFAATAPLLAVADEGGVAVWDVADPVNPVRLARRTLLANDTGAVAFDPGATSLAVTVGDHVEVFRVADLAGPPTFITPARSSSGDVALLPAHVDAAGPLLATITADGTVALWDTGSTAAVTPTVLRQSGTVPTVLAARPQGDLLAVGGEDGSVTEWHVAPRVAPREVEAGTVAADIGDLAATGSPATVAISSFDLPTVEVVRPGEGATTVRPGLPDRVASVDLDDGSGTIAVADVGGNVVVGTGAGLDKPRRARRAGDPGITDLQLGARGMLLAAANGFAAGYAWRIDLDELVPLGELPAAAGAAHQVSIRPDGTQIAVGGRDGVVVLYDVEPDQLVPVAQLPVEPGTPQERAVGALTWLTDGRHLAVATELGITVFDPDAADPTTPTTTITGSAVLGVGATPAAPLLVTWGQGVLTLRDTTDPTRAVTVAEYPTGQPDASVAVFSGNADTLALGSRSTWLLLDLTAAVALATDPVPAACLAARTSPLPPELASTLADLQLDDACAA